MFAAEFSALSTSHLWTELTWWWVRCGITGRLTAAQPLSHSLSTKREVGWLRTTMIIAQFSGDSVPKIPKRGRFIAEFTSNCG